MINGSQSFISRCSQFLIPVILAVMSQSMMYAATTESGTGPIVNYRWAEATPAAQWPPRSSHVSVVFQDKIWVLGGAAGAPSYGGLNDV